MQKPIVLAGSDEKALLQEALDRLNLPEEAIEYEIQSENEEDLLPGAESQIQIHVRIRADYLADKAIDHVINILELMGIEAEVGAEERNGVVMVQIYAKDDTSLLIGKDGQNLDALQYMISRMVMRSTREAPMLVIDVGDYRLKQFEKLEILARKAVKRARETDNEIELCPMGPLERKYLHHFLAKETDIKTLSRGEEPDRFVVLFTDK